MAAPRRRDGRRQQLAGSPAYIALLDDLFPADVESRPGIQRKWEDLDDDWEALEEEVSEDTLRLLARTAYLLLAQQRSERVSSIIARAKELHIAKNAGYAGASNPDPWANFRLSLAFGVTPLDGVLVRMSDKYIRITNLRKDPSNERVGESILDTLADLGAYALIAACLIEEEQGETPFIY